MFWNKAVKPNWKQHLQCISVFMALYLRGDIRIEILICYAYHITVFVCMCGLEDCIGNPVTDIVGIIMTDIKTALYFLHNFFPSKDQLGFSFRAESTTCPLCSLPLHQGDLSLDKRNKLWGSCQQHWGSFADNKINPAGYMKLAKIAILVRVLHQRENT